MKRVIKLAIYECKYRIGFTDVGGSNKLTNKAILKVLENAGGMQSEDVGYGLNQIEETSLSWVLLAWKVQVLSRPLYNEELLIKTWARDTTKVSTYRDYEIYDSNNKLVAIATSKWTLINIRTKSLEKITEELISKYNPETKSVFENNVLDKLKEPEQYDSKSEYKITRSEIDINDHVHNLYYLDFAYEALPEDVYRGEECNNIEIMYKKQIKLGDEIICLYSKNENKNIVSVKSKDEKVLHAIINLY